MIALAVIWSFLGLIVFCAVMADLCEIEIQDKSRWPKIALLSILCGPITSFMWGWTMLVSLSHDNYKLSNVLGNVRDKILNWIKT